MSLEEPDIFIFFHIANLKYARRVFQEIYREVESSGLSTASKEIHFSIVGRSRFRLPEGTNIVVHNSADLIRGEFTTLDLLRNRALENPDGYYLYIHTKGISRFWNRAIRDWRRYMTYFCVTQYSQAIRHLEDSDACGVDLSPVPKPHFSGNFWWAKGEYLISLPSISSISSPDSEFVHSLRHNAEFWIGMGGGKMYSLHDSGINVYQRHIHRFPRRNYAL